MKISAKRNSDPSNRKKVIQVTKEKGIKEILANTTVDKINNKGLVKYLYEEEKLAQLGEHFYGSQQSTTRYTPNRTLQLAWINIF